MHWDLCFLSLPIILPLSIASFHGAQCSLSASSAQFGGAGRPGRAWGNYSRNAQLEADMEGGGSEGGDGKNEEKEGGPSRESTEVQSNLSYGR